MTLKPVQKCYLPQTVFKTLSKCSCCRFSHEWTHNQNWKYIRRPYVILVIIKCFIYVPVNRVSSENQLHGKPSVFCKIFCKLFGWKFSDREEV